MKKTSFTLVLALGSLLTLALLTSCAVPTATPKANTAVVVGTATRVSATLVGTVTPAASATNRVVTATPDVKAVTNTPAATLTPANSLDTATPAAATDTPQANVTATATQPVATPSMGDYLDDRSSAPQLVRSYMNAINREEYLRAYSYWRDPTTVKEVGTYDQFRKGFNDTANVDLTVGTISSDVGAGQLYYSVATVFTATSASGTKQLYSGCYLLHTSNPGITTEPPYRSLGMEKAFVTAQASGADSAALLANACKGSDIPQLNPQTTPEPTPAANAIDASVFRDDRTDGVQTLRSLFNAVNRKEYARAYGYWRASSSQLQPYKTFAAGYANTSNVKTTFGTPISDAGAGQLYVKVPVVLMATEKNNALQTFVGCYTLRMSQPAVQGTPPFQPWGVDSAVVKLVANTAAVDPLLASACK